MGDMLSQAEIDALLRGGSSSSVEEPALDDLEDLDVDKMLSEVAESNNDYNGMLTDDQKDILGEIGNISMGTAATTLFALLQQKVWITTPKVKVLDWQTLTGGYSRPCVGIRIDYKEGLKGSNILILKERDVKIIASLMMGGDGTVSDDIPLSELDMSAIGEAMNQMVGSSSTSLSSMIKRKIDIDTPQPFLLNFSTDDFFEKVGFAPTDIIVCVSFKMEIGTLIDSEIMQILPLEFASDMVDVLMSEMMGTAEPSPSPQSDAATLPSVDTQPGAYQQPAAGAYTQQPGPEAYQQPMQPGAYQQPMQPGPEAYQQPMQPGPGAYQQPMQPGPGMYQQPGAYQQPMQPGMYQQPGAYQQPMQPGMYQQPPLGYQMPQLPPEQPARQVVNAQPVQFPSFDVNEVMQQKENIGIIMDVPLEITVELGRTREKIKNILEYSPGTIVPLDKLAGEPIDVLVNGKYVAKGEVVVIDENFAVRITDIISVEKRI